MMSWFAELSEEQKRVSIEGVGEMLLDRDLKEESNMARAVGQGYVVIGKPVKDESGLIDRKTGKKFKIEMKEKALRYNEGKPQLSYLDFNCLTPCVRVMEYGATKYARDNWKKGFPVSALLDCLLRHIAAIQRGEVIDPESGQPHIGHIQCNAMFLGLTNNEQDIQVLPEETENAD